jgi:hypothetical protein
MEGSLTGSGFQNICTMRRYRPRSTLASVFSMTSGDVMNGFKKRPYRGSIRIRKKTIREVSALSKPAFLLVLDVMFYEPS